VTKGGVHQADQDSASQYNYQWFDAPGESWESYTSNNNTYYSTLYYDQRQDLAEANIHDGQERDIYYKENIDGRIAQRDTVTNSNAPHARYYYYGNIQVGDVSNDGTSDVNYAASITDHRKVPGSGLFQFGATTGTHVADFDASFDPINGLTYDESPSTYTVQDGDTLSSIALQIWGDANFWYLIADANGLDASASLSAGQNLIIPNQVANNQNNASTYKVYNPNDAMGNVSPTMPPKADKGCGEFGAILMAVIAIAVAIASYGALTGPMSTLALNAGLSGAVAGGTAATATVATGVMVGSDAAIAGAVAAGAASGAIGSIVSQGVGLAAGITKSFNWADVGMAAIGGAVGAGLGPNGFDVYGDLGIGGNGFGDLFAQGALRSAVTQGIGVATGLQKSFDWAAVAASGLSSAAQSWVGAQLKGSFDLGSATANADAITALSGAAGLIVNAAARTLITGTDFGDNIMKALPDTIAQTIGSMVQNGASEQAMIDERMAPPPDTIVTAPNPGSTSASLAIQATPFTVDQLLQSLGALPEIGTFNSDGNTLNADAYTTWAPELALSNLGSNSDPVSAQLAQNANATAQRWYNTDATQEAPLNPADSIASDVNQLQADMNAQATDLQNAVHNSNVTRSLLDQIAEGEGTSDATAQAHGLQSGYDVTYDYGHYSNTDVPLTQMTLGQVIDLQDQMVANGSPSSVVGRYQFRQQNLMALQDQLGLDDSVLFTPELQDQMANALLNRRGLEQFLAGNITETQFQTNLSDEWASIADPELNGNSRYGQPVGTTTAQIHSVLEQYIVHH